MDKQTTAEEILRSFENITIKGILSEKYIMFSLKDMDFLIQLPSELQRSAYPYIYTYNNDFLHYPHIVLREVCIPKDKEIPEGKYRLVCLYENESVVWSLYDYAEKISNAIVRLEKLLNMTDDERKREYQKEFLYYWNEAAKLEKDESDRRGQIIDIYIENDAVFSKMQKYCNNSTTRFIQQGVDLTDTDTYLNRKRVWTLHREREAFFIPISDSRDILPPLRNKPWSTDDVKEIVYGKQISHINLETFSLLKENVVNSQNIDLIFCMHGVIKVCFGIQVKCKYKKERTLLEKICEDAIGIKIMSVRRIDYAHLNDIIGNDSKAFGKKVMLVGCGSLGSYVAAEIVKNGISDLILCDGDILNDENKMRWFFAGFGIGQNKALVLSEILRLIHPQLHIGYINANVNEDAIKRSLDEVDLLIFTIGNSDTQLEVNRLLKDLKCHIPVVYIWLEAGGEYSHILVVNYEEQGCFECLFTDENGSLVNNRANKNTIIQEKNGVIRNGCGGTRGAYGTAVILRTTAVFLSTMKYIFSNEITQTTLIDILPETIKYPEHIVPMKGCRCCGNREEP